MASKIPSEAPKQLIFVALIPDCNGRGWFTDTSSTEIHPIASVVVRVYCPNDKFEIPEDGWPLDHIY